MPKPKATAKLPANLADVALTTSLETLFADTRTMLYVYVSVYLNLSSVCLAG